MSCMGVTTGCATLQAEALVRALREAGNNAVSYWLSDCPARNGPRAGKTRLAVPIEIVRREAGLNSAQALECGTPGRPMSDAELDSKLRELAAYGAPFVDADGLIAAVRGN